MAGRQGIIRMRVLLAKQAVSQQLQLHVLGFTLFMTHWIGKIRVPSPVSYALDRN